MKLFGLDAVAKESCDRHREDHAQIAEGFARIVADLDPTTIRPQIGNLIALLRRWLDNHINSHDLRLQELLTAG
jgi:hemerythrin